MKIVIIKARVRAGRFMLSARADEEAAADNIDIADIRDAILDGEILEQYPDTGRGERCLILGFAGGIPIHLVCGRHREAVVIITVGSLITAEATPTSIQ